MSFYKLNRRIPMRDIVFLLLLLGIAIIGVSSVERGKTIEKNISDCKSMSPIRDGTFSGEYQVIGDDLYCKNSRTQSYHAFPQPLTLTFHGEYK